MAAEDRRRFPFLPLLLALSVLLLLRPAAVAASEIGPPLRLLTAAESGEELLFQGAVGYDSRTYKGAGAFGDVDAKRLEGELRVVLPSAEWEFEGRLGVWRLETPVSAGGMSATLASEYPVLGGGVRTLLWQDNAATGWRVGVAGDLAVAMLEKTAKISRSTGERAMFTCDKPWELRLAFPVSHVTVPRPYLKEGWIAQDVYTREYYGGPFFRVNRLAVKAVVQDSIGDRHRYSADLKGSSLPGLFGGARWVRRTETGERSYGFEAQYKDGFQLGFFASLSL